MRLLRTLLVFVTVAATGIALLPEALAYVNDGKDPATAHAALQTPIVKTFEVNTLVPRAGRAATIEFTAAEAGHADMRGSLVVAAASK